MQTPGETGQVINGDSRASAWLNRLLPMQRFTALRNLLLLLTLLTLIGLLTHAFWMKRVVRIDGFGPGQQLLAVDDREGGGRSEAQLIRNKEGALLRCRLSTQ